jgi:hypothetical protein
MVSMAAYLGCVCTSVACQQLIHYAPDRGVVVHAAASMTFAGTHVHPPTAWLCVPEGDAHVGHGLDPGLPLRRSIGGVPLMSL